MLIKSIELNNFRQFKDKKIIEFACEPEKNVTVVMGDNGSGKTTLAQAFCWVLYGDTDFKDKKVLNKKILQDALADDELFVRVDLNIELDGKEYKITRRQAFVKKNVRVQEQQATLEISYLDGIKTKYITDDECIYFIKNVLPEQLSKFFIFSGERIDNMSNEIQKGRSQEFCDTVRNLVGLNAIMNALNHIGDKKGNSTVIGRYNKKIDDCADTEVSKINRNIEMVESDLLKLEKLLDDLSSEIDLANNKRTEIKEEILKYSPQEELNKNYKRLDKEITVLEKDKIQAIKRYFNYLNNNGLPFFQVPAFSKCSDELKDVGKIDKGIPNIHANTIKYLIKNGKCICGHAIEEDELKHLTELLDYLPPKSLGTMISQYTKKYENDKNISKTFFDIEDINFKNIRSIKKNIEAKIDEQTKIYNRMIDLSGLSDLKRQQVYYEDLYRSKSKLKDLNNQKLGALKIELKNLNTRKDSYININETNRKFILYREYARELYNKLNEDYANQEKETRELLEQKINTIFETILEGGLSLTVDENYNIKVKVNELEDNNDDIERSTAQNYSVIFAFIAGIIEMAKKKENDDNKVFYKANTYPLIMDAPLSAFDKKRIKNICNTLPTIANQAIFFIKDTDGEVAEKYLDNCIGKKYEIVKESLIISSIKERG